MKVLGPAGEQFLESRRLDPELAARFGIYTCKRVGHELLPSPTGDILTIPFYEDGQVVAVKYRTLDKKFWQEPGGKSVFWNIDTMRDPLFERGHMPIVIAEGELDALTAVQCGFPLAVSVPDGAPPALSPPSSTSATNDAEGKFKYVWHAQHLVRGNDKRFILAVDNDAPGQRLQDELVRRLLAARCSFVEYPPGCKDLNDVLMQYGPERVALALNNAKPVPVRGLYRLSDYPERESLVTYSSGWPTLDQHFCMFPGEFCVISGIPSHGKSTFVLNLLVNMARIHGWRTAIFSPEMPAVPFISSRLRSIYGEHRDRSAVESFLEDRFVFIDGDPTGKEDDENFSLDWILDRTTDAVIRDGIRCLVIDPWNEIEHARTASESVTDYVGRSIRTLKRFARLRNICIIVIAHPTKDVWKEGKVRKVSLYDIESSAHWFNKSDHGLIIERQRDAQGQLVDGEAIVHVDKSRFAEAGVRGSVRMRFDVSTHRFTALDGRPVA